MAKYFKHYPKELYTLEERPQALDAVTNICTRFSFEQSFKENTGSYYEYQIQEGENAEMIAHKLYGSPEQHWIIFMMNDIIDPYYDWPMSQNVFKSYLNSKYKAQADADMKTGAKWTTDNIKSWYINEKRTNTKTGAFITESREVDQSTWTDTNSSLDTIDLDDGSRIIIEVTKSTKTYYEYEVEENEKKRTIKLLRGEMSGPVTKEFKKVIG